MRFTFASLLVLGSSIAIGAPGDEMKQPFAIALTAKDTQAAQRQPTTGERSVGEQQGSARYRFPIEVPAGRNGMTPSLALAYASDAPLRGDLAVGWSLDLPVIERDTERAAVAYRSTLGGGSARLIPNTLDPGTGARYRAELDDDFVRYTFANGIWTARSPDGVTRTFGWNDGVSRWHLTRERDPYGNEVVYTWASDVLPVGNDRFYVGYRISKIEWTSNAAAGLAAHAKVDFVYAPLETCGGMPVGARGDHRFGQSRLFGARRLGELQVSVRDTPGASWRMSRKIALGYDAEELRCGGNTPLRYLTRIDVTAYDQARVGVAAPPITFRYGPKQRDFSRTIFAQGGGRGDEGKYWGQERALLDLDGDGVLDRAWVTAADGCLLSWQRGLTGGAYTSETRTMRLPSANWMTTEAELDVPTSSERCTIGGQLARRPTDLTQQSCDFNAVTVSYHFLDFDGDGLVDLLTNVWESSARTAGRDFPGDPWNARQENGGGQGCPAGEEIAVCQADTGSCQAPCPAFSKRDLSTCACEDCTPENDYCADMPDLPDGGGGGGPTCTFAEQSAENDGAFVWRVHYNLGGGALAGLGEDSVDMAQAAVIRSAVALPPNGNEMNVDSGKLHRPRPPTLIDLDGDGWLDVIGVGTTTGLLGPAPALQVWRGPLGAQVGTLQLWSKPTWDAPEEGTFGGSGIYYRWDAATLADVNADGLPDIVDGERVWFNQVGSFGPPIRLGFSGALEIARLEIEPSGSGKLEDGAHGFERVFSDLDADGIPELATFGTGSGGIVAPSTARAGLYFHGGTLHTVANLPAAWDALRRPVLAEGGAWHRTADAIDMTADGLPDMVTWVGNDAIIKTDATTAAPMRLLEQVDNGRGGVTRFEYATVQSAEVGAHLAPHWVVRRVIEAPGAGQPEQRTTYTYSQPARGIESALVHQPPEFLGFRTIVVEQSGQLGDASVRTIKDVAYDSGRGRIVRETTLLRGTDGSYRIERQRELGYTNLPLLDGAASVTVQTSAIEHTYGLASVTTRAMTEVWTPSPSSGPPRLYLHGETHDADGLAPSSFRIATHGFTVRNTADEYRVLETSSTRKLAVVINGVPLPATQGMTTTTYDAAGLPIETRVYQSTAVAARTQRTFDALGNLVTVKRPNQVAAGSALVTSYTYDAHRLAIATTANELGHSITEVRDAGSGAVVERRGPNKRGIIGKPTQWQTERFVVDGFGRVREHEVSTDPLPGETGLYVQRTIEWVAYHDNAVPNRRVTSRLRDHGGSTKLYEEETFDGRGRVVTRIERRQDGSFDPVTTYAFDAGGELRSVSVPDPRVQTAATVSYVYDRDGLGRVTRLARPDGSATLTSYDGVAVETQESSPDEGNGRSKTRHHDALGRLVRVVEGDAVTTYRFDIHDRVESMTDADGNLTSINRDWIGNRTRITRGARGWSYVYDLHDNAVAVTSPMLPGADVALHTSTASYDALDRVTARTPASRDLTQQRRIQLGIGTITYAYDGTALGKVARIVGPAWTHDITYDARGRISREQRAVTIAGITRTQWVTRGHDALGAPTTVTWDDGTTWQHGYDTRGQLAGITWRDPGSGGFVNLAGYQRGVAGLPLSRSGFGQQRVWQHDALGRVLHDRVFRTTDQHTYLERTYGYDGHDELRVVAGTTDGLSADAVFEYDARGRIAQAEGPLGYTGAFAYSHTGNVLTANVAGAQDVPDREAVHAYGAVDPQAVDQITDTASGETLALTYDPSGNLRQQGDVQLTWDGDDKLREITAPDGTEIYWLGPGGERIATITPDKVKLRFAESETHLVNGAQVLRWHHVGTDEAVARIENGTAVELHYADPLRSLMLAVERDGTVAAAFLYGAFGEVVAASGAADHRRQFNGNEVGVANARQASHRVHSPITLSWTSADPLYRYAPDLVLDEPARANLYAFSLNNPLRYLDPDGLDAKKMNTQERNRFCTSEGITCPKTRKLKLKKARVRRVTKILVGGEVRGITVDVDAGRDARIQRPDLHVHLVDSEGRAIPMGDQHLTDEGGLGDTQMTIYFKGLDAEPTHVILSNRPVTPNPPDSNENN